MRFQSSVPTLVQLATYSLHRFKRNNSTCLVAVAASGVDTNASLGEDEEEDYGMVCQDEDDDIDAEVMDTTSKLASSTSSISAPGGRFLVTAPT
jgi:hypothetical protein